MTKSSNPSSQTTNNGSSNIPPNTSSTSPSNMTMNGNKMPAQKQAISDQSSAANIARPNTSTINNSSTARQGKKQWNIHNSISSGHSVGLSGVAPADNDSAYCTEIARRSVARAALHLGMEAMEGEALDSLGSILMGYMEMVGTTISSNVESSGRSSAHANAYDALNTIEDCTAPAATQLGMVPSTSSARSAAASQLPLAGDHSKIKEEVMREHQQRGWEGLASFIFGPDWFSMPLEGEDDNAGGARNKGGAASATIVNKDGKHLQSNGISNKPGGKTMLPNRPGDSKAISMASPKTGKGKQLSNMTGGNERSRSVSFSLDRKPSMGPDGGTDTTVLLPANDGSGLSNNNDALTGRWHAPYLNSIPPFPLVTSTDDIANPHRLSGSKKSLSMHDYATETEACRETTTSVINKQQRRGSASDISDRKAEKKAEAAEKAMRKTVRIPDEVYNTMGIVWGSIKDTSDLSINKNRSVGDMKSRAESKKPAVDSSSKQPSLLSTIGTSDSEIIRPSHVPNFLPSYPTDEYYDLSQERLAASISTSSVMGDVMSRMHHREKRKASDITPSITDTGEKKVNVSERDSVRRSVIGLGKSLGPSYWGSMDDNAGEDDKHNKRSNKYLSTGNNLTDVTVAPVEGGTAATSPKKSTSEILPLGRASGSRLSKILEGSQT